MAQQSSSSTVPNLIVQVKITIAPSDVAEFSKQVAILYPQLEAEPEFNFIEMLQKADEPGVFCFIESWSGTLEWFHEVCVPCLFFTISP